MNLNKLRIAELNVLIHYTRTRMLKQAEIYKYDFVGEPDIKVGISDETIKKLNEESPHLTEDDIEYIYTGAAFYERLLKFNGIMLHSSAVVVDNEAYLFSAPSGTGKSTHTNLWLQHFKERAYILNDDKPAIREWGGRFYAYGTPWSGKTDLNVNKKVPIKAIIFIERSENNFAEKISNQEAAKMLYYQGYSAMSAECKISFLEFIDKLIRNIPIYRLGANISDEAVTTVYNAVNEVK